MVRAAHYSNQSFWVKLKRHCAGATAALRCVRMPVTVGLLLLFILGLKLQYDVTNSITKCKPVRKHKLVKHLNLMTFVLFGPLLYCWWRTVLISLWGLAKNMLSECQVDLILTVLHIMWNVAACILNLELFLYGTHKIWYTTEWWILDLRGIVWCYFKLCLLYQLQLNVFGFVCLGICLFV